jgi:hypothetical protein
MKKAPDASEALDSGRTIVIIASAMAIAQPAAQHARSGNCRLNMPLNMRARERTIGTLREALTHDGARHEREQYLIADDRFLLRFLRASRWDVNAAAASVTAVLAQVSRQSRGSGRVSLSAPPSKPPSPSATTSTSRRFSFTSLVSTPNTGAPAA